MKRLVIDTNLLVLLVVGTVDRSKIGRRRLEPFNASHLFTLIDFAKQFRSHVSTPNILTEASNLIGSGRQQLAVGAADALAAYIQNLEEVYVPSKECAVTRYYQNLGLADAGLGILSRRGDVVLTQDGPMYGMLLNDGLDIRNFWHMVEL